MLISLNIYLITTYSNFDSSLVKKEHSIEIDKDWESNHISIDWSSDDGRTIELDIIRLHSQPSSSILTEIDINKNRESPKKIDRNGFSEKFNKLCPTYEDKIQSKHSEKEVQNKGISDIINFRKNLSKKNKNIEQAMQSRNSKQPQTPRLTSSLLSQLEKSSSIVEFEKKDGTTIQLTPNVEALVQNEEPSKPVLEDSKLATEDSSSKRREFKFVQKQVVNEDSENDSIST